MQDPEFQASVKEKAGQAVEGTKNMCVNAYHTVQDPEFQHKVKDNLNKGVKATKKLITGQSEEVETLDMRPEGEHHETRVQGLLN